MRQDGVNARMKAPFQILVAVGDRDLSDDVCDALLADGRWEILDVVSDGSDALRVTGERLPDAVLMDVYLPGLDCQAYLERLAAGAVSRLPFVAAMTCAGLMEHARARLAQRADLLFDKQALEDGLGAFARMLTEQSVSRIACDSLRRRQVIAGNLLDHVGMSHTLRGFGYLTLCAALMSADPVLTKDLQHGVYRIVAQMRSTKPNLVERSIRHAIERALDGAKPGVIYSMFGNTMDANRGKPTNSETIAVLAEAIRRELKDEAHGAAQPGLRMDAVPARDASER